MLGSVRSSSASGFAASFAPWRLTSDDPLNRDPYRQSNLFVSHNSLRHVCHKLCGGKVNPGPVSTLWPLSAPGSQRSGCQCTYVVVRWYFTFDLQASEAGVASQLKAFESSPFRKSNLTAASIISFSFTNGSEPASCGSHRLSPVKEHGITEMSQSTK